MKSLDYNNGNRLASAGLTLLELLVVLTILIALGGIVVASLPGLLERTQTATAAANVSEIDSAIRRNLLTQQGRIGNRFDSLIVGSGGGVAGYVGGVENFRSANLNEAEVGALAEVGITEVIPAAETAENATFDSHLQDPVPLTAETQVCQLVEEYAATALDRLWNIQPQPNKRYLVFGLGQRCSLVGGTEQAIFKEAPVHFSDDRLSNPKNMYSRYLIIVELDSSSELAARARYVGVGIPHRNGITGMNDQLEEFYSNQQ